MLYSTKHDIFICLFCCFINAKFSPSGQGRRLFRNNSRHRELILFTHDSVFISSAIICAFHLLRRRHFSLISAGTINQNQRTSQETLSPIKSFQLVSKRGFLSIDHDSYTYLLFSGDPFHYTHNLITELFENLACVEHQNKRRLTTSAISIFTAYLF